MSTEEKPKEDQFLSMLLGRETTLKEYMIESTIKSTIKTLRNSWDQQTVDERKRRRKHVRVMYAEFLRLREENISATGWAEFAIEGVITGDLEEIKLWVDGLLFKDESEPYRSEQKARFAHFRQLAQDAIDSGFEAMQERLKRERHEREQNSQGSQDSQESKVS